MQIPQIRTSRWFIYVSSGLLVFLCLSVLVASLMLTVQSSQVRIGQVGGSSMEPTLQGPRAILVCSDCRAESSFARDAWTPNRPVRCRCCNQWIALDDNPTMQHGEVVRYMSPRWRKRTADAAGDSFLQRGEIVVLERDSGSLKELKRVVALPGEEVGIRDGDLWINQRRYQKTLAAALSQSVLIAAWDNTRCTQSLDAFLETQTLPPTNDLPLNAHDSHERVTTCDFGIALRCTEPMQNANLELQLADSIHSYRIQITAQDGWTASCNYVPLARQPANDSHHAFDPQWIIVAMVDGRLLVGDQTGNGFAHSLSALTGGEREEQRDLASRTIAIVSNEDGLEFDLAMIFRDVVYRGYGDLAQETIPAGPGYVVLGDNISISDDSRGPAGSQVRWEGDRIRGIVVASPDPLGSLLRQRSLESHCPCD